MAKTACTFFLAIDENGKFVIQCERDDDLLSRLADDGGAFAAVYEVTLMVAAAKPKAVKVEIPEDTGETVELTAV